VSAGFQPTNGELLRAILALHDFTETGFRRLDQKIDGVEQRLDAKITRLDLKIDDLEYRMNRRFDRVDMRFDALDARVARLEHDRA